MSVPKKMEQDFATGWRNVLEHQWQELVVVNIKAVNGVAVSSRTSVYSDILPLFRGELIQHSGKLIFNIRELKSTNVTCLLLRSIKLWRRFSPVHGLRGSFLAARRPLFQASKSIYSRNKSNTLGEVYGYPYSTGFKTTSDVFLGLH